MTNEDQRAEIVSKLVESIIDDQRALSLVAEPLVRRVNWTAKVDINDAGKIIGINGAHIKSLRVLVGLMGQRFGEVWHFKVEDPDEGPIRERRVIEPADNYRPEIARNFLLELLETFLDEVPEIGIERDGAEFKFVVGPKSVRDYELLVEPYNLGRETLAPIAALGTLFRAYGKQQGVSFRVEVPGRKEGGL